MSTSDLELVTEYVYLRDAITDKPDQHAAHSVERLRRQLAVRGYEHLSELPLEEAREAVGFAQARAGRVPAWRYREAVRA